MEIAVNVFKPQPLDEIDVYQELALNIVTQLELKFWLDGTYPSQKELESKFLINGNVLKGVNKKINSMLTTRGLPPVEYDSTLLHEAKQVAPDLDPYFVVACSLICDTFDKRARSVKLKAANLTSKQFTAFLTRPNYLAYYQHRVTQAFQGTSESAKLSLARNVEAGDLQSIKYYHEFTGIHDPNREIQINLGKLINLFMEILSRHVDSKVIDAVSRDFDAKLLELPK